MSPLYRVFERNTHEELGEVDALSPLEAAAACGLLSAHGVYAVPTDIDDDSTEVTATVTSETRER